MTVTQSKSQNEVVTEVLSDETGITEVEIAPNGRLYLFGASIEILNLLREIGLADSPVNARLENAVSCLPSESPLGPCS
jgi:hypothetical protein